MLITFTSGNVRAVGGEFFSADINDLFSAGKLITITYSDGVVDSYTPTAINQFRGYMSTSILTSMRVSSSQQDYVSMDNLRVSTVPEPASMAALGLGVAAMLRRRKSAK
jgi:hypothetical protein